ncbi:hypothetical protein BRC90_06850 [Halobacteriales archaeon QS_4_69_34]|nr:MAG: hypothetical protein BRC90_06850 [Halobacteriales archaeon QS_4_69_34]
MTNNDHSPDDTEALPSDDHRQAIEASEHAVDALRTGNLSHARRLLDEARTAIERAQPDDTSTQEQREIAYDCYD